MKRKWNVGCGRWKVLYLAAIALATAVPLMPVYAADRVFNKSWDARKGPLDDMDLRWFQGESIDYIHRARYGSSPVTLTNANQITIWQVTGTGTDATNTYLFSTGAVQSAAGSVKFEVAPANANLTPGAYLGYIKTLTLDGTNITDSAVLAYQDVTVVYSPQGLEYSLVEPLSVPWAGGIAGLQSQITSNDTDITAIWVELNYVSPTVAWDSSDAGSYETGSTQTTVNLSFDVNKTMAGRIYTNGYAEDLGAGGDYTFVRTNDITATATFTVQVTDERTNTASVSQTLTFQNRIYYGTSADETNVISNAEIIALSKTWEAQGRSGTAAPSDEYIYVIYPSRLGACTSFELGGFPTDPWPTATRSVTNASGYAETFRLYRSANKLTSGSISYDIN